MRFGGFQAARPVAGWARRRGMRPPSRRNRHAADAPIRSSVHSHTPPVRGTLQTRAVWSRWPLFSKPPQHATLGELIVVFRAPFQPRLQDAPCCITARCPCVTIKDTTRPAGRVPIIEDGAARFRARGRSMRPRSDSHKTGANSTRSHAAYNVFYYSGCFRCSCVITCEIPAAPAP